MKKIYLALIFSIIAGFVHAQVTTLHENFDVHCASATFPYSGGWSVYNPIPSTMPSGSWACSPNLGRTSTPGMKCTGTYGSAFHLDSSYLISPPLDLSGYTDSVYFQFDAKTTNLHDAAQLDVMLVADTGAPETGGVILDGLMSPFIGMGDSSAWTTHVVNISRYRALPSLHIGFRYTSTVTTGSIWFIDNVNITTTPATLGTAMVASTGLGLRVIDAGRKDQISFECSSTLPGSYSACLYDMVGRIITAENITITAGVSTHRLAGLSLAPGLYVLRVSNDHAAAISRLIAE